MWEIKVVQIDVNSLCEDFLLQQISLIVHARTSPFPKTLSHSSCARFVPAKGFFFSSSSTLVHSVGPATAWLSGALLIVIAVQVSRFLAAVDWYSGHGYQWLMKRSRSDNGSWLSIQLVDHGDRCLMQLSVTDIAVVGGQHCRWWARCGWLVMLPGNTINVWW